MSSLAYHNDDIQKLDYYNIDSLPDSIPHIKLSSALKAESKKFKWKVKIAKFTHLSTPFDKAWAAATPTLFK